MLLNNIFISVPNLIFVFALDKYRFAGQNLAMISSSNEISDINNAVRNMVTMWTNESSDANMSIIRAFSIPNNGFLLILLHRFLLMYFKI